MPTRRDYDTYPDRYRLGTWLTAAQRAPGADLHAQIVRLLLVASAVRVLDDRPSAAAAGGQAIASGYDSGSHRP